MRRVMLTLSTIGLFVAFTLAGCETTETTRPAGTTSTTTKSAPPTTTQKAPATSPQTPATK
jgi:hypothetical protein